MLSSSGGNAQQIRYLPSSIYKLFNIVYIVPDSVSLEDFWLNYLYKVSQLTVQEKHREKLLATRDSKSDEEIGWSDDEDDQQPSELSQPLEVCQTQESAGSLAAPEPKDDAPVNSDTTTQVAEEQQHKGNSAVAIENPVTSSTEYATLPESTTSESFSPPLPSDKSSNAPEIIPTTKINESVNKNPMDSNVPSPVVKEEIDSDEDWGIDTSGANDDDDDWGEWD